MYNHLIVSVITLQRWKGGITNDKKYFFENRVEKILTTVKKLHKTDRYVIGKHKTLCIKKK